MKRIPHFKIIIAVVILASFILRFIPWSNVMTDTGVQLKGADAYYFVRQAENLNNGGIPQSDPLFCAPNGLQTNEDNLLYSFLLSWGSKLLPLETVTAWSGPILGTLTVIAIFCVLKELFPENDYAVLTGTMIGGLTGIQFLARSYFGFGDRHVLETFFSFLGLFTLLRALRTKSHWYTAATIIIFILYTLSWRGAPTLISLILLACIIEQYFTKKINETKLIIPVISLALLICGTIIRNQDLIIDSAAITVLWTIIFTVNHYVKKQKRQLVILSGIFLVGSLIAIIFLPSIVNKIITTINSYLFPDAVSATISEYQPMMNVYANFVGLFNKAGIQVLIHFLTALGLYWIWKEKRYGLFFLGVVLIIITLAKIRAEYYLLLMNAISFGYIANRYRRFALFGIVITIYFAILYWGYEIEYNKNASLVFSNNDYNMAAWMKTNLPKPEVELSGANPQNQTANYWVLARWDIGYLYGYLAEKPMLAAPNLCNYLVPSEFFMITNVDKAYEYAKTHKIKYILVRYADLNRYYGEMKKLNLTAPEVIGGQTESGKVYYLYNNAYYETMNSRLYNFNGLGIDPKAIFYFKNKQIATTDNFALAEMTSDNGQFYGLDPFKSPLPLPTLTHFKLIHSEGSDTSAVKLFEVTD
jgi:asparagine N-glycosylation enzyme membrane subunit Stt3